MIEYVKFYHLYRTALFRAIRLLVVFSLLTIIYYEFSKIGFVFKNIEFIFNNLRVPLFYFFLFVMIEVFYRFKIASVVPFLPVSSNDGKNIYQSFTKLALDCLLTKSSISGLVPELLKKKQIQFMLQKANINKKEVVFTNISTEELAKQALEVAKKVNGKFVTTMDLFTAYLLLSESQTKLLFNKELKPEDLLQILQWARTEFSEEEYPQKPRVEFNEEGIGEALVTGWTLETKKYTNDLTYQVLKSKPLLTGREMQYRELQEALSKKENNNVLLVGERGVGKDTLISVLAYESFSGKLPEHLNHKRIFELMVGTLLAGANNRNELEARLKAVIDEISHSGNVILYIPEFQNVVGASSFNIDISGTLLPYLKNGQFLIIAAMTPGNYKMHMEKNPLIEVFATVKLEEPDKNTAIQMLFKKGNEIETKNKVSLTYSAVAEAVGLADRFLQDRFLPGSAVDLLAEVAGSCALAKRKVVVKEDVIKKIEEKTKISVAAPTGQEKELLLNLEEKLHARVVDQVEAVGLISEAIRRVRTGLASKNKPISFLFLGPTGVGKTETAKALASLYFKGEDKMIRLDMSEYTDESGVKRLLGAMPGEGEERGELTDKIFDNPFSLVLLDEFEKAHPKILDLFLQVLDDGRLTDNKGRTVSFANAIIIATSNAGSEFIRQEVGKGIAIDKEFQHKLLDYLQTNGLFKPELLNRFDAVVTFKPLGEKEVAEITKMLLAKLGKKLLEQEITVSFDDTVVAKVVKEGFDQQFGARPLQRFIQDNIEDLLSQKILKDEIKRGSNIVVSTDNTNNLQLVVGN